MASLRSPESVIPNLNPLSLFLLAILSLLAVSPSSTALNFLLNPFDPNSNGTAITLTNDASFENTFVLLINDSNQFSVGRAIHPARIPVLRRRSGNSTAASATSFSTSFVFSILPEIATSPGFGLCFFLSNSSSLPGTLASQYFGLFSNATTPSVSPLVAVEFDTGRNTDFNDIDGNHIGVNLNNAESVNSSTAGYFNVSGGFVPVAMRDGGNVRAWIDFDGANFTFIVTVAPANLPRPRIPTLIYTSPTIADYLAEEMFIGFSASKTEWVEVRRILAWSFSDSGPAREINTTGLPVFRNPSSPSSLPPAAIAGISAATAVIFLVAASFLAFWLLWRRRRKEERDEEGEIEEWEMEYWPHRYEYEELSKATNGFSDENLIGAGGFGKVYRAGDAAVKCVSHDSKQGLREFMAEISSMGRLQHKSLVPMRGWCNHSGLLMLVYDYMPNGSLNHLIFHRSSPPMVWLLRRRALSDVAEALAYLHGGYDQVVIHRDVKSSNILLDSEMRARLGDFGLAKLYSHGEAPGTTRVVGTLGYMAPELASSAAPTAASDVYSFGVVALEVACGRRPIEMNAPEEETVLVDWVRDLYVAGRVRDAVDPRLEGDCGGPEEVEVVLKLGLACCHPDPIRRPTMTEVVAVLLGEGAAAAPGDVLSALVAGESGRSSAAEVIG